MTADAPRLDRLLRRWRAAAGLTQEELAERAGVSVRTISDVERGLRGSIYRDTAERLAEGLGLEDAERAEFERVARGSTRRGPRVQAPDVARPTDAARIPVPATTLLGRGREVEVVSGALGDDDIRLLTLTGPGGVGKTRIAIEAATQARDHGLPVFFVGLSSISDPALVASTVAVTMGVTSAKESLGDAIAEHLGEPPALLVLDTFEHLIAASGFVAELLERCPMLTALVTSREALRLSGEHEVVISTLEVPAEAGGSPVEEVLRCPATALFVQRARAVRADLVLDERTAPVVRDICARLNGLPLAIELAAARVRHLSLEDLCRKLDDRLSVLTGGPRDMPRRQRTMVDTVAWSYELLSAEEQSLFRGLSMFAGGWTLEDAATVRVGAGGATDLLRPMSALVDKSLIARVDPPESDTRFSMLDVIRAFALDRCEQAGEAEDLRWAHAAHYLAIAEGAEPRLGGAEQGAWFQRLEIEHDNLRAALAYLIGRSAAPDALRLAGALWQFWRRQGHFAEGRRWLREALSLDPAAADGARAKVLWGAGWLAFVQGDYEEGDALSAQLLRVAGEHGSPIDERNALTVQGMILMARGRFVEALEPFERGLQIIGDLGPSWHLATSHLNLGMSRMHAVDLAGADEMITRARQMYEVIGDEHFEARCVGYLGYVALLTGDAGRAASLFGESLESFLGLGDLQGIAEGLEGSAAACAAEGSRDGAIRAARLTGAARSIRDRLTAKQYPFDEARMAPYLARARDELGQDVWDSARSEGLKMSMEEALERAL